jgi:hypothetical protein
MRKKSLGAGDLWVCSSSSQGMPCVDGFVVVGPESVAIVIPQVGTRQVFALTVTVRLVFCDSVVLHVLMKSLT